MASRSVDLYVSQPSVMVYVFVTVSEKVTLINLLIDPARTLLAPNNPSPTTSVNSVYVIFISGGNLMSMMQSFERGTGVENVILTVPDSCTTLLSVIIFALSISAGVVTVNDISLISMTPP
jgi:hypothetical protein